MICASYVMEQAKAASKSCRLKEEIDLISEHLEARRAGLSFLLFRPPQ